MPTSLSEKSQTWLTETLQHYPSLNRELLTKACAFAEETNNNSVKPIFAESTFSQGLLMADILLDLSRDSEIIAAALVYPGIVHHRLTPHLVIEKLSAPIDKLVSGVKRMEAIHTLNQQSPLEQQKQIENLRKMLLAMVDDVRVVLLKLAERLSILSYLKNCTREQQLEIARETMHLYSPLANRLGIGQIKWKMEDLSFRYLNPDDYQNISKALNMRRKDRDEFIHAMKAQLQKLLEEAQIENVSISGRAKHIYSIFRKMHKKRVGFSEIYDASAFRIIVPTIKDCYTVLGVVHSTWPHIPKEFDDYIAKPKPNGYRSIHTVVIGDKDINVEIQIRTQEMHDAAELGVAAHWKYKEGASSSTYEDKINWLREVMDWQKEVSGDESKDKNLYSKIFEDRVYVFTPNGDVFDLSAKATPLDFAYHVHTEVGNRCRGAKINNVLVPLTYHLKTGDRVQILTTKKGEPSRDWLNPHLGYLNTSVAKNKVKQWFKKQLHEENLAAGLTLWEKFARHENIPKSKLNKIAEELHFKTSDDLLAAVGGGDLPLSHITHHLKMAEPHGAIHEEEKIPSKIPAKFKKSASSASMIQGVGNLLTQLARCCKPIPGDPIVGYITKGRGITIHQQHCQNILQSQTRHPERLMTIDWNEQKPQTYSVDLVIEASDRPGLIRDISSAIANETIPLLALNTQVNPLKNSAHIYITIEISNLEILHKITTQLRQIPDVVWVGRR